MHFGSAAGPLTTSGAAETGPVIAASSDSDAHAPSKRVVTDFICTLPVLLLPNFLRHVRHFASSGVHRLPGEVILA
jgi:hypothetical protein